MAQKEDYGLSRIDLQKVADFLPYPFIIAEIIDGIHHNTYLNEKFKEEISYTLKEIPTIETWYEHAYPDDEYRRQVIGNWDEEEQNSRTEGKTFVKRKSRVTCKNGVNRWYEVKATVIGSVHVVAFVDLDKEITLQEELKMINANNDRMLSILGHDLRSPIANLMGISSLAADAEIEGAEFSEVIRLINIQSAHVLDLLDNTMQWAKLNFNTMAITPQPIAIEPMLKNILAIYETAIKNKNLMIVVDTAAMETLHSDPEILTFILRNLLSNAIKFTPESGSIRITTANQFLSITDSGIGIPETLLENLKNHQYSSRNGTGNEKGTGLGLQLVSSLAEKINGKLCIESIESKGTTVWLQF